MWCRSQFTTHLEVIYMKTPPGGRMCNKTSSRETRLSVLLSYSCENQHHILSILPPTLVLCLQPHLMWRSLEDAGALVDCLCPQPDILVLQLLRRAVHGLGNQTALRYLTLQRKTMCTYVNWVSEGEHSVGDAVSQKLLN